MKSTKIILVIALVFTFVFAWSHQSSQTNKTWSNKPTEAWLASPHQVVTNPDGVVRTKGHALELARLSLKYLFGVDEGVDVEEVGVYWIGYTKLKKIGSVVPKGETYFVKINKASGAVEEYGPYPSGL